MEQYQSDRSDVQGNGSVESSRQSSRRGDAFSKQLIGLGTDRNTSTKPTDQQFSISKKEALESDPIERFFQTHFLSRIEGQVLSQSERTQLAEINRKTPISEVPEKWRMAFAVARGRTIIEKVNCLPDEDINTENEFNSRYKSNIIEINTKGLFKVSTLAETQDLLCSIEDLKEDFKQQPNLSANEIKKYVSTFYWSTAHYTNFIDIKDGKIIAYHNDRAIDTEEGGGKPLPNSEILYNQLLGVLRDQQIDPSRFNLTQVIREEISNDETYNTLDCCIKNLEEEQSVSNHTYRLKKGSEGYYAISGTPNVYGILYLLKQHPSFFGRKEITSIEVEKRSFPNLILHIGERE